MEMEIKVPRSILGKSIFIIPNAMRMPIADKDSKESGNAFMTICRGVHLECSFR